MGKRKRLSLIFLDIIFINISYLLALYIRFDGDALSSQFVHYLEIYKEHFIYITAIKLIVLIIFKVYKLALKYSSISDLTNILLAIIFANVATINYVFIRDVSLPRSIYIISLLLDIMLVGGSRFIFRALYCTKIDMFNKKNQKKIMIIGAGDAGDMLIREYRNQTNLNSKPVAIIDDNKAKMGQRLNGVTVMGNREDIPHLVEKLKVNEIVIAMLSANKKDISAIVEIANTTHPDIIRYFMTIPEAVQLVIEAGSMANGGEIFVLDMGEPIKIVDLAKDLIKLSGYELNVDMEIVFTGLRPGEKLFEELLLDAEGICDTRHEKIFVGKPTFTDYKSLLRALEGVQEQINFGTEEDVKEYVQTIVPNYTIKDQEKIEEPEQIEKEKITWKLDLEKTY